MAIGSVLEIDGDELDRRIVNKITMAQYTKRIDEIKRRSVGMLGGADGEHNEFHAMFNEIAQLAIKEMADFSGTRIVRKPKPSLDELTKLLTKK